MKTCLNIASGIALVIAAATGASAQDAQPKQTLMPENEEARAFQEAVGYSSAVIHGDTIYLSGVVAGWHAFVDSLESDLTGEPSGEGYNRLSIFYDRFLIDYHSI